MSNVNQVDPVMWSNNALDAAARAVDARVYARMSTNARYGVQEDMRCVLNAAMNAQLGRVPAFDKQTLTKCMKKLEWEFKRNKPHKVAVPSELVEAIGASVSDETRAEIRKLHKRIEELEKEQRDEADTLLIVYQDGFYKGRAEVNKLYKRIAELEADTAPRSTADAERIVELEEALAPFARMSMDSYKHSPDEAVMTAGMWGFDPLMTFRLGDIRRARRLLGNHKI